MESALRKPLNENVYYLKPYRSMGYIHKTYVEIVDLGENIVNKLQ